MGQGRVGWGKILEEALLRGFEGAFGGWWPGGGPETESLGCYEAFGRSGPGTTDPF